MSWCVVHFIEENAVECVPNTWYVTSSKECFWPPPKCNRRRIRKWILDRSTPSDDWKVYKVDLFGCYDDLDVALKKAKKAEYLDSLSSSQEEFTDKRIIKRNRKYSSSDESSISKISELQEDDEGSIQFPAFPNNDKEGKVVNDGDLSLITGSKKVRIRPQVGTFDSVAPTIKVNHNSVDLSSSLPFCTSQGSLEPEVNQRQASSRSLTANNSSEKSSGHKTNKLELSAEDRALLQNIETNFALLNTKVDFAIECLNALMKRSTTKELLSTQKKNDELLLIFNLLPLSNENALGQIETWLNKNMANAHDLATKLSLIGGSSVKELVRKIMYRLFTNDLGMKFTWEGANNKKKFKELCLSKIIIESTRNIFPSATEVEIINYVKLWLVRCKDREEKALKKTPTVVESVTD